MAQIQYTSRLVSTAADGVLVETTYLKDEAKGKLQSVINAELYDKIEAIETTAGAVYTPKGSVTYFEDLPSDAKVGDVYNVENASSAYGEPFPPGTNFVWVEISGEGKWDALGGTFDLTEAILYTDEKLVEAKEYSDGKLSEAKTYADGKLDDAKSYTDGKLVEAKEYTDTKTDEKLTEAKSYADGKLAEAKSYTDGLLSPINSSISDLTERVENLEASGGSGDLADVLAQAKKYTDDQILDALAWIEDDQPAP